MAPAAVGPRRRARSWTSSGEPNPYWLGPFKNYKTFCPYLVGSHDRVARELAEYIRLGSSHFILDIPPSEEELGHIGTVFDRAQTLAAG